MSRQEDRMESSLSHSHGSQHGLSGIKRRADDAACDDAGRVSRPTYCGQTDHADHADPWLSSHSSTSPAGSSSARAGTLTASRFDRNVDDAGGDQDKVYTSANHGSSSSANKASSKRPRAAMSCTECRKCKIRCDRNVPRCSSCIRRGVPYLCKWGDARDDLMVNQPVPRMSPPPSGEGSTSHARSDQCATVHPSTDATPNSNDTTTHHVRTNRTPGSLGSRDSLYARIQRIEASLAIDAAASPRSTSSLSRSDFIDCRTRGLALLPNPPMLRSLINFYYVHVEPGVDVLATQSCFLRQIQPLVTRSQRVKAALALSHSSLMATIRSLPSRADRHPAIDVGEKQSMSSSTIATPAAAASNTTVIDDADLNPVDEQLDSLWQELDLIALMLVILQGAFDHLTLEELGRHGLDFATQADLDQASQVYCDAALDLVRLESRMETPTLTFLQVVVCLRHFYLHRGRHSTYATFNTMAIRLAVRLGLHRLGSFEQDLANIELLERTSASAAASSTSMSSQHASNLWGLFLPATQRKRWLEASYAKFAPNDLVLRESGRKVWHVLVCMDGFQASHYDGFYSVHPASFTTAQPINLSQRQIESALMSGTLPRPLPRDHPTEASFLPVLASLAQCSLEMADAANKGRCSYADLCAIEAQLRTILDKLPPFYRLDGHCENLTSMQAFHQEMPRLTFQRLLINETIHHRILKLHRLYLLVGLQSRAFEQSAKACISSSLRLVELAAMADALSWPGLRYWHLKLHLTDALSNLAVVLIHRAEEPETSETRHFRSCLERGVQILCHGIVTPYLHASIRVIRALAKAELSQRRRGTSNNPAGGDEEHAADDNRQDVDQVHARVGLMADTIEEAGKESPKTRTRIATATVTPPSASTERLAMQAATDDPRSRRPTSSMPSPDWQLSSTSFLEPATIAASTLTSDSASRSSSSAELDLDGFVSSVLPGETFSFWRPPDLGASDAPDPTGAEALPEDADVDGYSLANQVDWTDVLAQITASTVQNFHEQFSTAPFTRLN